MGRARRTSRRYRGARRGGIGVLIPVLAVLCVIAAGVLWFVNDNMEFTLDGSFFSPSEDRSAAEREVDANLIIEEPETATEEEAAPEETPESTGDVPQKADGVRALFIPIGEVKSEELFSARLSEIPQSAGVNTLVLEVKAEDGTLAFSSDSPIAQNAAVSGDDALLTSAISKAKSAGYCVSLYMSCFKDNEAARKNQGYSARTANKVIWLDNGNVRWLSAYSEAAREYLTASVGKLASFNPDGIILSNISFPAEGKTEILSYDKSLGTKQEMLSAFITEAKTAAGSVPLSAVYENYNDACVEESGQMPELFSGFDTLYVNAAAGKFRNGADAAAGLFDGKDIKLIPIAANPSGEEFMIR